MRRTEYGISMIIYVIVATLINALATTGIGSAAFLLYIPLIWFSLAQGTKRCHDRGNHGGWQFIPFYSLWLLFKDGELGRNAYGENPKGLTDPLQELLAN